MSVRNKEIELEVAYHASGRRTLKQRLSGQTDWVDLKDGLFANLDQAAFYKAVVVHIAKITHQGKVIVSLRDTSTSEKAI